MGLKDILVHLDLGPRSTARLALAVDLARSHQAHLTGLYVISPLPTVVPTSVGIDEEFMAEWAQQFIEQNKQDAQTVEATFNEAIACGAVAGQWRLAHGPLPRTVAQFARYADLTIVGQSDPSRPEPDRPNAVVEEVLFSSGRPLLMVPYAGNFASVGRNVLVAWKDTREAARAVTDAVAVMHGAEHITVFSVDPEDGMQAGHGSSAAIALHLVRHGLTVSSAKAVSNGLSAADMLLNQAADCGADLLVMGGYGHSRVRELVLGGVTSGILESATVPVLMSR